MPTKERGLDPRALDLLAFCRDAGTHQGRWPLAGMPRLAASFSAATDGSVAWTVRGERRPVAGGEAEIWLALAATADVPLECQRCLQTMVERLALERRYRFVRDESEAARLDEESEDDVLVLQPRLDLHTLLEDELVLSVPLVPRHAVCPIPLVAAGAAVLPADAPAHAAAAGGAAPHPFAVLAALRQRPRDGGDS